MRRASSLVGLVILLIGGVARGAAAPAPADTVRRFYDALLTTMQNGLSLGPKGRYAALEPVIGRTFDIPYMTRMATGAAWGRLSDHQRGELTRAFGRHLTATYAERFDRYSGQRLDVTGEQRRAADVVVDSRIVRAQAAPQRLNAGLGLGQEGGGHRRRVRQAGGVGGVAAGEPKARRLLDPAARGNVAEPHGASMPALVRFNRAIRLSTPSRSRTAENSERRVASSLIVPER